jgi:hypothetical protein
MEEATRALFGSFPYVHHARVVDAPDKIRKRGVDGGIAVSLNVVQRRTVADNGGEMNDVLGSDAKEGAEMRTRRNEALDVWREYDLGCRTGAKLTAGRVTVSRSEVNGTAHDREGTWRERRLKTNGRRARQAVEDKASVVR